MTGSRSKKIKLLVRRIGFYIPVTIYFVLFSLVTLAGYSWLRQLTTVADSSYSDIFKLLLSLALFVGSCILCMGAFTVCFAYIFFKWKQNKTGISVKITTGSPDTAGEKKQMISLHIHPILQPLMGYIRIRLNYDDEHYSEKFNLIREGKLKLVNTTLEGVYKWDLPEIREYRIGKVILYFEDFFQFFSFAAPVSAVNSFYTAPQTEGIKRVDVLPRKTEEQTMRIEEVKKIEGEYINYKNFESSDDVRRIVWKVYAKNKELVIRIPEILDPYASHIYFYASFYSGFNVQGNEVVNVPFLNYYKTVCWSLYQQFTKKGFEVRYVPDQQTPQNNNSGENKTRYALTLSSWHTDTDLKTYVDPRDAAIVVLSSLSDPEQVRELTERHGNTITFVFVSLTESLNDLNFMHWFRWIFVQQENDKTAAYRSSWNLSGLRLKIEQNEKKLTQLLKDHEIVTLD